MSINLQKCLRERRHFGTTPSLRLKLSKQSFDDQVYSDNFIMSQMTLERELPGHTGCVNTLDWSLGGDKLLSGSDDTKLNIYKPFENYKIAAVINTGHRANIFTAKFMPQTSDNIILSGAGDSEVRIFDLHNMESPLVSMYVCHSDQVKKICVYDDNPNEFLTCSQDGTVRQFDLRVPHICSPHHVRSFLTAQIKPARQSPIPEGTDIYHGCPNPIVDYSKYNIELNSMTVNKLFPHYFAVAGMNDYIYLHDRRMMPASHHTHSRSATADNAMDTLKCVKKFSPTLDGYSRPNKHITACKFSDTNGYELIGSWSSDGIYLFNINDSPVQSSTHSSPGSTARRPKRNSNATDNHSVAHTETTATTTATANDIEENGIKSLWKKVVHYYTRHDLSSALFHVNKLLSYLELSETFDADLGKLCAYMVRASILIFQTFEGNESSATYDDITLPDDVEMEIEDMIVKAESAAPHSWQGMWSRAIGYWMLGGGLYSNGCTNRDLYLEKSLQYGQQAKSAFSGDVFIRNLQSSSSTASNRSTDFLHADESYTSMIDMFLHDLETVRMLEGYIENTRNVTYEELETYGSEYRYKWITFMYVTQLTSDVLELSLSLSMSGLLRTTLLSESSSSSSMSPSSSNSNNNMDEDVNMDSPPSGLSSTTTSSSSSTSEEDQDNNDMAEVVETNEEDEESLYTRIMSRQIMDIYRRGGDLSDGDSDADSDFDLEALAILRDNANHPSFDTDVGVVKHRLKYTGHCNIETVKDVGFYGPHDEYIVSGSDRGHLFIWDKNTAKIVQILQADEDVVNIAKGHPFLPILAVSGIDSTIKIFKPTSRPSSSSKLQEPNNPNSYSSSSHLYEEEDIVSINREHNRSLGDDIYMTRSMYAAFLRMERQRRLFVINGIIDEEEAEVERALAAAGEDAYQDSSSNSSNGSSDDV